MSHAHTLEKLSVDEQEFLRGYSELIERHLHNAFLQALPEDLHQLKLTPEQELGPSLCSKAAPSPDLSLIPC